MTVARPALAEVLGALTSESRGAWIATLRMLGGNAGVLRFERAAIRWGDAWQANDAARAGLVREPRVYERPITVTGPAEALEVLHTRGLWPWQPGDESAPLWHCDRCVRAGWRSSAPVVCVCEHGGTQPPDLASIIAIASLGVTTLATVAALAGEVQPGAAVVWRALSRDAIQEHHRGCEARRTQSPVALVFSREARDDEWEGVRMQMRERNGRKRWSEACPYYGWFGTGGDDDPHGVHRAWPALRALHDCGVHLLACDPARVVLGVEALS